MRNEFSKKEEKNLPWFQWNLGKSKEEAKKIEYCKKIGKTTKKNIRGLRLVGIICKQNYVHLIQRHLHTLLCVKHARFFTPT